MILAPELCSRRDHLDVGWEQACGCQAYPIPPADVLQDSQGQRKTMWQSPDHLPHGRTLHKPSVISGTSFSHAQESVMVKGASDLGRGN